VRRGEVFVFLGPIGADKTTTVEILEGFRDRDGGAMRVCDSSAGHRANRRGSRPVAIGGARRRRAIEARTHARIRARAGSFQRYP